MSRGGANPNWEYQLVAQSGHYSDSGLRQRKMVEQGHRPPDKRQERRAKRREEKALGLANLNKLFEVLKQ